MGPNPDGSLFDPIVPESRWHPSFRLLREHFGKKPARQTMDEVFSRMGDRDGNFREQFQTSGFDARVWELYLFAALDDAGLQVNQPDPAPDFVLTGNGGSWGLEATTANLRTGESSPEIANEEHLLEFLSHELPIRLGSPLFSKLSKGYTSRKELAGLPFVLGLECFVSADSFFFSESPLGGYLYGVRSIPEYDEAGTLSVRHEPIQEHRVGEKVIPSGFFNQPGADQISAILFSNNGTVAKFDRMGYQQGIGRKRVWMGRYGFRADNDPNASAPLFFAEEVGERHERWSDGLVVFHNPNASTPLPHAALGDVAVSYAWVDGQIQHTHLPFHVFTSRTFTLFPARGQGVKVARRMGRQQLRDLRAAAKAESPPDSAAFA
jgi:hypothetical protein